MHVPNPASRLPWDELSGQTSGSPAGRRAWVGTLGRSHKRGSADESSHQSSGDSMSRHRVIVSCGSRGTARRRALVAPTSGRTHQRMRSRPGLFRRHSWSAAYCPGRESVGSVRQRCRARVGGVRRAGASSSGTRGLASRFAIRESTASHSDRLSISRRRFV